VSLRPEAFVLGPREFSRLAALVHERSGLELRASQLPVVRARVLARARRLGLSTFAEYEQRLARPGEGEAETRRLLSLLLNHETYFFREKAQLRAFQGPVLEDLHARKARAGDRALNVLCAGCASGEEVYTLASLVRESGRFLWDWRVRVVGMDLDGEALERGRRGVYHQASFREADPVLQERYFSRLGEDWQVRESVRRLAEWRQGSFLDEAAYAGLPSFDAVFCRNVFIYFSESAILTAARRFHRVLAEGGWLLLGHAESLDRFPDLFSAVRLPGAVAYRKAPAPPAGSRP
jgi:chemotaxis protein methyltransferase CheR